MYYDAYHNHVVFSLSKKIKQLTNNSDELVKKKSEYLLSLFTYEQCEMFLTILLGDKKD